MYRVEKNEVLSSAPDRLGLDVPEDVPLVEFVYLVFTRVPAVMYQRMYFRWSLCRPTLY